MTETIPSNFASDASMQESVDFADARGVVLPGDYYGSFTALQRAQATTIAGIASIAHITKVIEQVNGFLRDGGSFEQFKTAVREQKLAVYLPDYRLENIFRTNAQTAFNHGRYQQQKSVQRTRKWLMYSSILDSRTRPAHRMMNGTILPFDHAFWSTRYPPCGYQCRCTVISLNERQLAKFGGVTDNPTTAQPDVGWDFNPGLAYHKSATDTLDKLAETTKVANKQHLDVAISNIKNATLLEINNATTLQRKIL